MKMRLQLSGSLIWLLVVHSALIRPHDCHEVEYLSDAVVVRQLLNDYDKAMSPYHFTGDPVQVLIGIHFNNVYEISDAKMEITANIYLRRVWMDPRLHYNGLTNSSIIQLTGSMYEKLWVPDIYFPNARETLQHEHTVPNALIWLYPNGTLFVSARYTVILKCNMNLQYYPLDTQYCRMDFESFGYTESHMQLIWEPVDPIDFPTTFRVPRFKLIRLGRLACDLNYKTGKYPCVSILMALHREIAPYIIHTFIPSIVIVMASWVGFWIDFTSIPGRVSLSITTLLTMSTQAFSTLANEPSVAYVKAMNIWMGGCILIVFAAVVEFAIVHSTYTSALLKYAKKEIATNHEKEAKMAHRDAKKVDNAAKFIFPIVFVAFILAFWSIYSALEKRPQSLTSES